LRLPLVLPLRVIDASDHPLPPQNHFNYDDIDVFCRCALCTEYYRATGEFSFHTKLTVGHKWHCKCFMCSQRREAHIESLAAGSRRDLYSELSYLTHGHPYANRFLYWILQLIRDPCYKSDAWWATHSPKKPLNAWMNEWQKSNLSPALIAVSGMF
jgi:hypothetical protein